MAENTVKKTGKVKEFFKGVKSEFKKIVWPNFRTVRNNTAVVIAVTLVIGIVVYLLDLLFTKGFLAIFKL
ncbi:MAG: preprotein translocase subunit SecE [Clostridia bacterium]|nr:preprotein translocase subunit SecE [Clostridia bacterium]